MGISGEIAEKRKLKPNMLTPLEVSRLLTAAGHRITVRALVQWRQQGLLPPLTRIAPGTGGGPRAAYVWTDPEVLTQALSLKASMKLRARVQMAKVLTWLAGYEYPTDQIKEEWIAFEEWPWENTLRRALGASSNEPFSLDDALAVLGIEARTEGNRQRLSDAFAEVSTRLQFDPKFRAGSDFSLRQAEQIRKDLPIWLKKDPSMRALAAMVTTEDVRRFIELVQDYWSRPRLTALIRRIPDVELAEIHRDVRFMLRPYRAWLAEGLEQAERTGDPEQMALIFGPRIAWFVGRFLMLADIQIRRWGYSSHINQTVSYLEEWLSVDENRRDLTKVIADYREVVSRDVRDAGAARQEWERLAKKTAEYERLRNAGNTLVEDLSAIWGPTLRTIFGSLESTLKERAAGLGSDPEIAARLASLTRTRSVEPMMTIPTDPSATH